MSGRTCAVSGCYNTSSKLGLWNKTTCNVHNILHEDCPCHRPYKLHTFPKQEQIRKEWVKATNRKDFIPTKYSVICSHHFFEGGPTTINEIPEIPLDFPREVNAGTRHVVRESFPVDNPDLLKKWKVAIGLNENSLWDDKNCRVCVDHFHDSDFVGANNSRKKLKSDAVPSVFTKTWPKPINNRKEFGKSMGMSSEEMVSSPAKVPVPDEHKGRQKTLKRVHNGAVTDSNETCKIPCVKLRRIDEFIGDKKTVDLSTFVLPISNGVSVAPSSARTFVATSSNPRSRIPGTPSKARLRVRTFNSPEPSNSSPKMSPKTLKDGKTTSKSSKSALPNNNDTSPKSALPKMKSLDKAFSRRKQALGSRVAAEGLTVRTFSLSENANPVTALRTYEIQKNRVKTAKPSEGVTPPAKVPDDLSLKKVGSKGIGQSNMSNSSKVSKTTSHLFVLRGDLPPPLINTTQDNILVKTPGPNSKMMIVKIVDPPWVPIPAMTSKSTRIIPANVVPHLAPSTVAQRDVVSAAKAHNFPSSLSARGPETGSKPSTSSGVMVTGKGVQYVSLTGEVVGANNPGRCLPSGNEAYLQRLACFKNPPKLAPLPTTGMRLSVVPEPSTSSTFIQHRPLMLQKLHNPLSDEIINAFKYSIHHDHMYTHTNPVEPPPPHPPATVANANHFPDEYVVSLEKKVNQLQEALHAAKTEITSLKRTVKVKSDRIRVLNKVSRLSMSYLDPDVLLPAAEEEATPDDYGHHFMSSFLETTIKEESE